MNNFKEMWDFGAKDGVDFLHCNHVHPIMQDRVQKILQMMQKDENVKRIVLFGSSLEFRCSSYSDIDLYIEKIDPKLPLKKEPEIDCELDLVMDLDHENQLYRQIERTGLLLYERGGEKEIRQMDKNLEEKLEYFNQYIKQLGSIAVAFSGGVDSAFLLKAAYDVLGSSVIAVTIHSCIFPEREHLEAEEFCRKYGIRQVICEADVFSIEGFERNPQNRCYLCKRSMMEQIIKTAKEKEILYVAEGSNLDDDGDYRPGHQAVRELGIKSPLREAGMTKADVRALSRQMGLPTWEKPSFACLASRFVYGEMITPEKLVMADRAEQLLMDHGFRQVRVRVHGSMARIEVLPEEFELLMRQEIRENIVNKLLEYGFTYVTLDLKGYRTGSMNEILNLN